MPTAKQRPTLANDSWREELMRIGAVASSSATTTPSESLTEHVFTTLLDSYEALREGVTPGVDIVSVAQRIGENARVPILLHTISAQDIATDADTSYERMLRYRADLRIATEPLLQNQEAEFSVFARYVETGNEMYLDEMRDIASRYEEAARRAKAMEVPEDAVLYHVDIVNALNEFAAVLDTMARFANDPIASISLLRAYNTAEQHMFTSFDALSIYYANKTP